MALPSIPASRLVNISPSTIGTGGTPLAINTVLITNAAKVRTIGVQQFGSLNEVSAFYGAKSDEYKFAAVYFNGYEGATKPVDNLFVVDKHDAAVGALYRSGSLKSMEVSDFANLTGEITGTSSSKPVAIDATTLTSATSFSDLATKMSTADLTWTFNEQLQTLEFTTEPTADVQAFFSGDLATQLNLTEETGAQIEQKRAAQDATELMEFVKTKTLNWGLFTFLHSQSKEDRQEAVKWTNSQNKRFMYVDCTLDAQALIANNPACFGQWVAESDYNGTAVMYGTIDKAAMVCGTAAAIDWKRTGGRINFMYRGQSGLKADVTTDGDFTALKSNGYSYYGAFATANDRFQFIVNGFVSGEFKWIDNYIIQIYLNAQLQLSFMTMETSFNSIPYNDYGKEIHRSAAQDPINEMLNFGGIRSLDDPKALSEQQKMLINTQAGFDSAASQILTKGYLFIVNTADAQTRGLRGSMPCTLWYTDGGSVQSVNVASVNVQ